MHLFPKMDMRRLILWSELKTLQANQVALESLPIICNLPLQRPMYVFGIGGHPVTQFGVRDVTTQELAGPVVPHNNLGYLPHPHKPL